MIIMDRIAASSGSIIVYLSFWRRIVQVQKLLFKSRLANIVKRRHSRILIMGMLKAIKRVATGVLN